MVFIDFGFGKYLIWIGEYRNKYSIEYYTCCNTWGILKYLFFPIQRFSNSYRHLMWNQGLCLGIHHSFSFQSWWLEWFYVELIWVNCNYWKFDFERDELDMSDKLHEDCDNMMKRSVFICELYSVWNLLYVISMVQIMVGSNREEIKRNVNKLQNNWCMTVEAKKPIVLK